MDLLLESGKVDQRVPFFGPPGLSAFEVFRQRGTSGAAAMTTPDVVEDGTVPGLYRLLLDEDTTITSGKTTESLALLVTAPGMTSQLLRVVLYKNLAVNVAQMNSAPMLGTGTSGDKWRGA